MKKSSLILSLVGFGISIFAMCLLFLIPLFMGPDALYTLTGLGSRFGELFKGLFSFPNVQFIQVLWLVVFVILLCFWIAGIVVASLRKRKAAIGGLILFLSRIAMYKAVWNIIVSNPLCKIANIKRNVSVIPCGAYEKMFVPMNKEVVRAKLGWGKSEKVVAFAGAFDREVKNPQLAKDAIHVISDARILELKGYSRKEVNFIFNAVDCLLMTSHNEGSPQVIKEAMLCGTPIVSVDVGDVKDVCGLTEGTYICKATPQDIAASLNKAFTFGKRTDGRKRIIQLGLTNELVAKKILAIYTNILDNLRIK